MTQSDTAPDRDEEQPELEPIETPDADADESLEPEGTEDLPVEGTQPDDTAEDEDDALSATAEADAVEPPDEDETAAPAASPGDQPSTDETEPTEHEAEPEPEPFRYRVDGTEIDVPDATVQGDTITLTRDSWDRHVRPNLANRSEWHRREQGYRQQIQEIQSQQSEEAERAKLLTEKMDALLSDRDALLDFADNFEANAERLRLQVENEMLRGRAERVTTERQRQTEEEIAQQAIPKLDAALDQTLDALLASEEFKDLPLDRESLKRDLWAEDLMPKTFVDVQKERDRALRLGLDPDRYAFGVDPYFVRDQIRRRADVVRRALESRKRVEKAQEQNDAALGKKRKPKPKTPTTTTTAVPSNQVREYPDTPEGREQWRRDMLRG